MVRTLTDSAKGDGRAYGVALSKAAADETGQDRAASKAPIPPTISVTDLEEFEQFKDHSADAPAVVSYLQKQYVNQSTMVLWVFRLWEAYGCLYAAWRDKWTARDVPYRRHRALRFARAASKLSLIHI